MRPYLHPSKGMCFYLACVLNFIQCLILVKYVYNVFWLHQCHKRSFFRCGEYVFVSWTDRWLRLIFSSLFQFLSVNTQNGRFRGSARTFIQICLSLLFIILLFSIEAHASVHRTSSNRAGMHSFVRTFLTPWHHFLKSDFTCICALQPEIFSVNEPLILDASQM